MRKKHISGKSCRGKDMAGHLCRMSHQLQSPSRYVLFFCHIHVRSRNSFCLSVFFCFIDVVFTMKMEKKVDQTISLNDHRSQTQETPVRLWTFITHRRWPFPLGNPVIYCDVRPFWRVSYVFATSSTTRTEKWGVFVTSPKGIQ